MKGHTAHPDLHEVGLVDDCERCAELARDPLSLLDTTMTKELIVRTLRNRFGGYDDSSPFGDPVAPRSETEALAMTQVMTALERTGQLTSAAPFETLRYLEQRWGIGLAWVEGARQ